MSDEDNEDGRRKSTYNVEPKQPSARLRVPKGFFSVMEVFVRALLKNKPMDVFDYGARLFEKLLQIRTTTGHDPAVHGMATEDGFNIHTRCGKPNCKKCKKRRNTLRFKSFSIPRGSIDVGLKRASEAGSKLQLAEGLVESRV